MKRIDIHDPLSEICARLGIEPSFVSRLEVTARGDAVAVVYKRRESDGKKYVDENGDAAIETLSFKVST